MVSPRSIAVSPQSRAVLSLVLGQGRGYGEIAGLLSSEVEQIQNRAHDAADELVAGRCDAPPDEVRRRLVDYLLGQQSRPERDATRELLGASEPARAWAAALSIALEPFAPAGLPDIPARAARHRAATRRRGPAWHWRLAGAGLAAAALLVIVTSSSDAPAGGTHRAGTRPSTASAQVLRRLVLVAPAKGSDALGAAAIVRRGGQTVLLLQAQGLAPNRHDTYAVWLYNTQVDSRLLGIVSPAVGLDGAFSSGVSLPDDAVRFHQLLVTRETRSPPSTPGQVVLQARLALS